VGKMMGQDAVRETENVPLSNSTINRRIEGMPHDAEEVLHDKQKNNSFSMQVVESTDCTNKSYVVVSVRLLNDGEIQENLSVAKRCLKQTKR
jgi:hypothetical protein